METLCANMVLISELRPEVHYRLCQIFKIGLSELAVHSLMVLFVLV